MIQNVEKFVALAQAAVDTQKRVAGVVVEGVERLSDLNMKSAKANLAEASKNAKLVLAVKDAQDLAALRTLIAEPLVEKTLAYSRSVYEVLSQTQAELSKLVEEQAAAFNAQVIATLDESLKNAPAGSDVAVAAVKRAIAAANDAYDTVAKATKQVVEIAEANVAAAANAGSKVVAVAPAAPRAKKSA